MISDDIAVVVIGRNEGKRLLDCLASIQSDVKCIVYVDSASSDGSAQAAERLGARVVDLDAGQPFTAARARNEGFAVLRKLRPDIRLVQFIDGDCELDKNWLNTVTAFIEQRNDVAVVCGRRRERYPSASVYNRLCDLEWDTPVGQTMACGGDSLVRAGAFEAAGGFRPQLIAGEEPELCLRLRERGWKIWRLDVEMTRHDAAMMRFGQWWSRAVRFGYGTTEVAVLHWHSPLAAWKTQLARAVFWGGMLPALIGLAALAQHLALFAAVIYPIQVLRLAITRGPISSKSWTYAFFVTLAKFPEFQGVLKFCWYKLRRQSSVLIEYK
jgi:GT2 family glycosyltransferase